MLGWVQKWEKTRKNAAMTRCVVENYNRWVDESIFIGQSLDELHETISSHSAPEKVVFDQFTIDADGKDNDEIRT